jgi:hypothetical protein
LFFCSRLILASTGLHQHGLSSTPSLSCKPLVRRTALLRARPLPPVYGLAAAAAGLCSGPCSLNPNALTSPPAMSLPAPVLVSACRAALCDWSKRRPVPMCSYIVKRRWSSRGLHVSRLCMTPSSCNDGEPQRRHHATSSGVQTSIPSHLRVALDRRVLSSTQCIAACPAQSQRVLRDRECVTQVQRDLSLTLAPLSLARTATLAPPLHASSHCTALDLSL